MMTAAIGACLLHRCCAKGTAAPQADVRPCKPLLRPLPRPMPAFKRRSDPHDTTECLHPAKLQQNNGGGKAIVPLAAWRLAPGEVRDAALDRPQHIGERRPIADGQIEPEPYLRGPCLGFAKQTAPLAPTFDSVQPTDAKCGADRSRCTLTPGAGPLLSQQQVFQKRPRRGQSPLPQLTQPQEGQGRRGNWSRKVRFKPQCAFWPASEQFLQQSAVSCVLPKLPQACRGEQW